MRKPETTQYNLDFPTDAGMRARILRALAREKFDEESLVECRVGDRTVIQLLAPKNDGMRRRLERLGAEVREELIFQVELPNHHWELHKLAKTLADKDINILSLYTTVEGDNMRIVLAVDQPANAVALFEKLGFDPDYSVRS
jgi:hypothetical protein